MSVILTPAELATIQARWSGQVSFEEYDRDPRLYGVSVEVAGDDIRFLLADRAALAEALDVARHWLTVYAAEDNWLGLDVSEAFAAIDAALAGDGQATP